VAEMEAKLTPPAE